MACPGATCATATLARAVLREVELQEPPLHLHLGLGLGAHLLAARLLAALRLGRRGSGLRVLRVPHGGLGRLGGGARLGCGARLGGARGGTLGGRGGFSGARGGVCGACLVRVRVRVRVRVGYALSTLSCRRMRRPTKHAPSVPAKAPAAWPSQETSGSPGLGKIPKMRLPKTTATAVQGETQT